MQLKKSLPWLSVRSTVYQGTATEHKHVIQMPQSKCCVCGQEAENDEPWCSTHFIRFIQTQSLGNGAAHIPVGSSSPTDVHIVVFLDSRTTRPSLALPHFRSCPPYHIPLLFTKSLGSRRSVEQAACGHRGAFVRRHCTCLGRRHTGGR